MERRIGSKDILLASPTFSNYFFGPRLPGRKLMYVQGFNTFALLERYFFACVSNFVAQFIKTTYGLRPTVIPAFIELDRSPTAPAWQDRSAGFSDPLPDSHRETVFTTRGVTRSGLSADFMLGVKHNALYAAVLPEIVESGRFRVIAIVRDAVAALISWQTLDLPISRGRLPAGERFRPELAAIGRAELDLTDKQIRICYLLQHRFAQLADRVAVIPYEAFVTNPV